MLQKNGQPSRTFATYTFTTSAWFSLIDSRKENPFIKQKFKELTETWAAFKNTREKELVSDILAGKQAEAAKISGGIQKERYEKMMGIIGAM